MSVIGFDVFCSMFGKEHMRPKGMIYENEGSALLSLCALARPRRFVELGVSEGRTAKGILTSCPWIEEYVGVDVPPDFKTVLKIQQGEVPAKAGERALDDKRFRVVVCPEGTAGLDLEKEGLKDVGMVFIDADHTYEGVKRDTELARRMLAPRGVIAWHDYNSGDTQVKRYIDELNMVSNPHRAILVDGTHLCFELVGFGMQGLP